MICHLSLNLFHTCPFSSSSHFSFLAGAAKVANSTSFLRAGARPVEPSLALFQQHDQHCSDIKPGRAYPRAARRARARSGAGGACGAGGDVGLHAGAGGDWVPRGAARLEVGRAHDLLPVRRGPRPARIACEGVRTRARC